MNDGNGRPRGTGQRWRVLAGLAVLVGGVVSTSTGPVFARPSPVAADAPAPQDGRALLVAHLDRYRTESFEHRGELTVFDSAGAVERKQWQSYRQGHGGDTRRLIRFLAPSDVRGVSYLLRQRPAGESDEWLFLPWMGRERRAAQGERDRPFFGTTFNMEDLQELDPDVYDVRLLDNGTVEGRAVRRLEIAPRRRSIYARRVLSLDAADLRLVGVDYYSEDERQPRKRLALTDYAQIDGRLVATTMEMTDLGTRARTVVRLRDVRLDRPQPADRYTIANLVRWDEDSLGPPAVWLVPPPEPSWRAQAAAASRPEGSRRFSHQMGGYAETRLVAYLGSAGGQDAQSEGWGEVLLRYTARAGPLRLRAAVRAESTTADKLGPIVFDPADRRSRRTGLSLREFSLTVPVRPTLHLEVGRMPLSWGSPGTHSPAVLFAPRDLTDPLGGEELPIWGVRLRAEAASGLRAELLAVPVTTPWRLPDLGGRHSPLASINLFLSDVRTPVPRGGFGAARVAGRIGSWDVGGWARSGVRPAPILTPYLDQIEETADRRIVPVERRYVDEAAVGVEVARELDGWLVTGELGVSHSDDTDLGNAVIVSVTGSRSIGRGGFTGAVVLNAIEPRVSPLLLVDQALVPAVVLAVRQFEPWGNWTIGWLGTFDRVGGILRVEIGRNLTNFVRAAVRADLIHGAMLSPARTLGGDTPVRATLRWSW